jgi:transposase
MKHKGNDYKISAVNYYLKNKDSMDNVCKIFNCKKSTLKDWVYKYKHDKNLTRKNRKSISYKVKKDQVKTAIHLIDTNEQLTMEELLYIMKQKYNGGLCEKFMVRKNPRPKPNKTKENPKKELKYDEMRLVHGLLRCKSGCGLWNRDRNGSSNIYKIAETAINKLERPSYLCRETISNHPLLPSVG